MIVHKQATEEQKIEKQTNKQTNKQTPKKKLKKKNEKRLKVLPWKKQLQPY